MFEPISYTFTTAAYRGSAVVVRRGRLPLIRNRYFFLTLSKNSNLKPGENVKIIVHGTKLEC